MHMYNAWLPPPVAEQTKREGEAFAGVVKNVVESYNPDDPESVYATLKWVSVIDLFVKAKSEICVEDVSAIVKLGLELFHVSENKLYAQVRWGNILVKLLNKLRQKLTLEVQWRPLYDIFIRTHFTRNTGPEGWSLRQQHFETVTSLVTSCRGFFPSGSASEETSNKDLSTPAKAVFELLKWRVFGESHLQKAVPVILSLANDPNWRTRSATLTFLQSFMYRHTFVLSNMDKQQIWKTVEKLLTDNQLEVREHAAAVLAALMKSGDEKLAEDFRQRAYEQADAALKKRRQRSKAFAIPVASIHGSILALAACLLSVPYDMPSWLPGHFTLLARFVSEPSPLKSTVTKAMAEFRRTHADTWNVQKDSFSEEQLEVLAATSSSSSYFA